MEYFKWKYDKIPIGFLKGEDTKEPRETSLESIRAMQARRWRGDGEKIGSRDVLGIGL